MEPVLNDSTTILAPTDTMAPTPVAEVTPTPFVPPTVCFSCERDLKHADVVMLGLSVADASIAIHPHCLKPGKNEFVKSLSQVHVHVEPGRPISPAKTIVVRKKIKEIFKAAAIANERKKQEAKAQEEAQKA